MISSSDFPIIQAVPSEVIHLETHTLKCHSIRRKSIMRRVNIGLQPLL